MRRLRCATTILAVLALGALAGCDSDSDGGTQDGGAVDQALNEGGAPDSGGSDALAPDAAAGNTVKVTHAGKSTVVSLSKPTPVTFEGTLHAKLDEVIKLALPAADQSKLAADFVASDGYRAGSKSTCKGVVPVPGANFVKGYIDVNDRKLRWDTALAYPGCVYVKDLAEILLTDK